MSWITLCYVQHVLVSERALLLISAGFTAFHVALKPVSTTLLLEEKWTVIVSPTETMSAGGRALQCVPEGEIHTLHFRYFRFTSVAPVWHFRVHATDI